MTKFAEPLMRQATMSTKQISVDNGLTYYSADELDKLLDKMDDMWDHDAEAVDRMWDTLVYAMDDDAREMANRFIDDNQYSDGGDAATRFGKRFARIEYLTCYLVAAPCDLCI